MRILVGMPEEGSKGGSGTCEPPFVRELCRLGLEVEELMYTYADTTVGFSTRAVRVMRTVRSFRKKLRSGRFDVVHLNTSFDKKALVRDLVTLSLMRPNHTKVFLKFHGSDPKLLRKNWLWKFMSRCLFARAVGIGVLSSEERANFIRAGVAVQKLFVVCNVVNDNTSVEKREVASACATEVPQLLFIGRFIPEKGLADVIRACKLVRDRGVNFMLICLGDGPARRDAEREVARLDLHDYVQFTGFIPEEEAASFYASGTVLVFPTYHFEGFPMTIFNAVAAGLPIITTRIRAAADYLQEPNNCLWAGPEMPEMLANKIVHLLQNSALRKTMSDNNRRLATRFSRERVTQEYLKTYEAIVRGDSGTERDSFPHAPNNTTEIATQLPVEL